MADKEWKEVSVSDNEVWDEQSPIEGELLKIKSNVGPNESMMYTIKTKDGSVNVWGTTVLDTKFEDLTEGTMVRIEPLGKVKSPSSGRSYKDFKVLYIEGSVSVPDDLFPGDQDAPSESL